MKDRLIELIREVSIVGKTYTEYIEAVADKLIASGVITTTRYWVNPDGSFKMIPTVESVIADSAMKFIYDFQNRLRCIFLDMCNYNDYDTLNLLQIDSAIEALYDTFIAELKKKYTESEDTE